jgi:hypothetical protein
MEVLSYNSTINFIQSVTSPQKESARRRLNFGTANTVTQSCAQEANSDFVQKLMTEMAHKYCQKWEFDFEAGQPLPSSSNSRFHYKQIQINTMPSVYSPITHSSSMSTYEENLSDAENRFNDLSNKSVKSDEFVFPANSQKKMLKKPSKSAYSTPKKGRATLMTGNVNLLEYI